MKRYFYITIHFSPQYEGSVLIKLKDNFYKEIKTGDIYYKRLLYDFGWGQENGFELLPQLSFNNLINLIEQPKPLSEKHSYLGYTEFQIQQLDIWRCNLYGAIAVIMQDYTEKFVDFLYRKIDTDYFSNPSIRENFKNFSFSSQKTRKEGKIPGGVLTRSYEDILSKNPKWNEISSTIVNLIYS